MKHLILLACTCLASQMASAGTIVTYKDAESGSYTQEFYDKSRPILVIRS
jgi:hypothetical protein